MSSENSEAPKESPEIIPGLTVIEVPVVIPKRLMDPLHGPPAMTVEEMRAITEDKHTGDPGLDSVLTLLHTTNKAPSSAQAFMLRAFRLKCEAELVDIDKEIADLRDTFIEYNRKLALTSCMRIRREKQLDLSLDKLLKST